MAERPNIPSSGEPTTGGRDRTPKLMPRRKLWTALERTYKQREEPDAQTCVQTTIQGWPVTLLKCNGRTYFHVHVYAHQMAEQISEAQFMAAYGSKDPEFVWELIRQLANVGPHSKSPDVEGLKFALATVEGMAPRDPLEALICAQMAAVHSISMMYADRTSDAAPYTMDMAREEQSFTRLSRTYSALTTALDRHKNAGDRKVAAQQLIADGAQANGNALPQCEDQTYSRFERTGQHGEIAHGSQDPDFVSGLFGPLTRIGAQGRFPVDEGLQFVRAAVRGMAPRDPVEAQLCAHMAIVHSSAMMVANRLTHDPEDLAEMDSAERSLNRLLRTFCALMEAFDRHRGVGDRKIVRQQVSLAQRAQAIVGDVHQNGAKGPGKTNGHASA
jgi:hypothetical protein